jgi:hypothetical protein
VRRDVIGVSIKFMIESRMKTRKEQKQEMRRKFICVILILEKNQMTEWFLEKCLSLFGSWAL